MPERPSPLHHIVDIPDATPASTVDDELAHRPRALLNKHRAADAGEGTTVEVRRAYVAWSTFEDAFIRQEFLRGRESRGIGAALGRSPGSVRTRLRKLGVSESDIRRPMLLNASDQAPK